MPGGRPTTYTPEKAQAICKAMADGASTVAAAQDAGIPMSTLYNWLHDNPEFLENYTRAREVRGEHYGNKVAETADRALAGEVDPNAARVAIDGYKWTAARMAPKNWGDKKQHEHSGPGGGAIPTSVKVELVTPDDGQ